MNRQSFYVICKNKINNQADDSLLLLYLVLFPNYVVLPINVNFNQKSGILVVCFPSPGGLSLQIIQFFFFAA